MVSKALAAAFGVVSLMLGGAAAHLALMAADPPDSNFTVIAVPARPPVIHLRSSRLLRRRGPRAVSRWMNRWTASSSSRTRC